MIGGASCAVICGRLERPPGQCDLCQKSPRYACSRSINLKCVCVYLRETKIWTKCIGFRCFRPLSPTSSALLCLILSIFFFPLSGFYHLFPSVFPFSSSSSLVLPLFFLSFPFHSSLHLTFLFFFPFFLFSLSLTLFSPFLPRLYPFLISNIQSEFPTSTLHD